MSEYDENAAAASDDAALNDKLDNVLRSADVEASNELDQDDEAEATVVKAEEELTPAELTNEEVAELDAAEEEPYQDPTPAEFIDPEPELPKDYDKGDYPPIRG